MAERQDARRGLHARPPGAFGEESEDVGSVFAAHAAVALAGAQHEQNLQVAVSSRDLISQAKLLDVATELAEAGTMPGT